MKKKLVGAVLVLLAILLSQHRHLVAAEWSGGFVKVSGMHFLLDGRPFFANGFNAYWLMTVASDPSQRNKVSSTYSEASSRGLSVARTWAFSDGGNGALQTSPGIYNEQMFQGLDFVVSEARMYGIRLILSLANNYDSFGGKAQYVNWARGQGQSMSSDDEFFTNDMPKGFYKNHVTAVITRTNTFTGIKYKDDPTILAWELMNEARCLSDHSGSIVQEWITEMTAHVKSIDNNHLLEAALEGFYGQSAPEEKQFLSGLNIGTDFISNNQIKGIDFATIHSYPDQWLTGSDDQAQRSFLTRWLDTHIDDARDVLQMPILVAEFGKSEKDPGFNITQRDALFTDVYSKVYWSARSEGPAAGGLFWQLLAEGMDSYKDGYEIVVKQMPRTTSKLISQQCRKLRHLGKLLSRLGNNMGKLEKDRDIRRSQWPAGRKNKKDIRS